MTTLFPHTFGITASNIAMRLLVLSGKRKRKRRKPKYRKPELTIKQILAWADLWHERTGKWPKAHFGRIPGSLGETWAGVDSALKGGRRSLLGGSSLARLLEENRGVRNIGNLPPLSVKQILAWADQWHARTGEWPRQKSGRIPGSLDESWRNIDNALLYGLRGFPGGSSLAQLLKEHRGKRNRKRLPKLSETQILRWANKHFRRTGRWPSATSSGHVGDASGETWVGVNSALQKGLRGLKGGETLAQFLFRKRGVRYHLNLPPLSEEQILAWADLWHARTGKWPHADSGRVLGTLGETWKAVDMALRKGHRGLPGGTTLRRLLQEHRKSDGES